ncbi:MAG: hypothetical protein EAZ55_13150 [Cytophagales bacterium]|nr:MAG: hypothetical protein EAZ55_13150 [Cytophagales bacterium]
MNTSYELNTKQIFKGDNNNPLLAPRGVFIKNNMLFVADTAQNRVFIWKKIPTEMHQAPEVVLGQYQMQHTGRNNEGEVSASSLLYPSGLWTDGKKLIVADAWNHRVLIWNEIPTQNAQPADIVIGQPDFESNLPNIKGISQPPNAKSLYWCYGVFSDGKRLWIADTGNRRVLFYENIPTQSFAEADGVIGQNSFEERDYDPANAVWPYAVKINPQTGQLAIADTQYYRILLWENWKDAFQQKAQTLIGQPNPEQNGMNQFDLFPKANTLSWTYDICFYKTGIWIADTGNSRLLWYVKVPTQNNQPADDLIGQKNFTTGSENLDTIRTTENTLYWAFSIATDQNTLAIADTGNHRIILVHLDSSFIIN